MRKIILLIAMVFLLSTLYATESGTEISRDVDDDLVRYKVTNTSDRMDSKSGFKMLNDDTASFLIYVESDSAGADAWLIADSGSVYMNVPTGEEYGWYINDVKIMGLTATSINTATWAGGIIDVQHGGTGVSEPTDGAILLGSGAAAVTPLALVTAGSILIGDGATDPTTLAAFTSATGDLKVEHGGTGQSTFTSAGVLIGNASNAIAVTPTMSNGYILIGNATAVPSAVAAFTAFDGYLHLTHGGLGEAVNGYTGLVAIDAGGTQEVDSKSELEAQIADVTDFAEADGESWSGDHEWWTATINSFQGAANGYPVDVVFQFDGETEGDGIETFFQIKGPTTTDKTISFQDHSGIVAMDGTACWDLEGTNLSITNGVLNASISYGDVSIGAANYLYIWATGNTQNVETDNWRVSAGATDLVWEVYNGASWDTKETKTP